jgi:phosphoglycerol transferase MdoB-like AlkP superfamily enzyme
MEFYQSKHSPLPGSSLDEVLPAARSLHKPSRSKAKTRRILYVNSQNPHFRTPKVFLNLFWDRLAQKSPKKRLAGLKLYRPALDTLQRSTLEPKAQESFDPAVKLYRLYGTTREGNKFCIQIKENAKTGRKYLVSIFPWSDTPKRKTPLCGNMPLPGLLLLYKARLQKANAGLLLGLLFLTQEIILKLLAFRTNHIFISLGLTALWTLPLIVSLTVLFALLPRRPAKVVAIILASLVTVVFIAQYSFIMLYGAPASFAMAGAGLETGVDFIGILFAKMAQHWWQNGLFLMTLTGFFILLWHLPHARWAWTSRRTLGSIGAVLLAITVPYLSLLSPRTLGSPHNLYFQANNMFANVETFGLLTAERLDIQRLLFGFTETAANVPGPKPVAPVDPEVDYRGLFAGKNLIFIVGESFSGLALRPDTTPTLYKLQQEGFNFTNFYTPTFYSTIGGEFMTTTGLLPSPGRLSGWQTGAAPDFKYALGFWPGYQTQAYHNWLYNYYHRDISRPSLGFQGRYWGCYNGLEKKMDCRTWPASDSEFAKNWGYQFTDAGEQPKATYILTVSGHGTQFDGWSFGANAQSRKHRTTVIAAYPNLSENGQAYLAANMELDLMVAELLRQAEVAGELDNTVVALVGDHVPYAMTPAQCNELATLPNGSGNPGQPLSDGFFGRDTCYRGRFQNPFILWTPSLEPTEIKKVGYSVDILPTLLNLFDIPHDPTEFAGRDLLDTDTEGLAIFSDNRSWISDRAKYDAATRKWQANPGYENLVDQAYIDQINAVIAGRFALSERLWKNGF